MINWKIARASIDWDKGMSLTDIIKKHMLTREESDKLTVIMNDIQERRESLHNKSNIDTVKHRKRRYDNPGRVMVNSHKETKKRPTPETSMRQAFKKAGLK